MRSNDIILGLPYDYACFTLFQEKMLLELKKYYPKIKMGHYYHFASSLHIYERYYKMMENICNNYQKNKKMIIPKMNNLSEINKLQYNEKIINLLINI